MLVPFHRTPAARRFDGEMFELALPAGPTPLVTPSELAPLAGALGIDAGKVLSHGSFMGGKFLFVELSGADLARIRPDGAAIKALPSLGLIAMAEGAVVQHDGYVPECAVGEGAASEGAAGVKANFTCRNFIPNLGIDEDVATGSIQVPLNAYWSAKLGKAQGEPLLCLQASRRGGFVRSRSPGDGFVYVAGGAALSFSGALPL